MKKIGLVLSGGGLRGMAHIGLIKAMQEHDLEATEIAGTSIGALVGALYANGTSTNDMLHFFKETPLFQYNFFTFNKPGLIDTERYYDVFKTHFNTNNFDALQKKLYVVATDLLAGKEVMFHQGTLIHPLLASAALTPVFSPVEISNVLYADGGIMNNFPLEYLQPQCDTIIGSNVSLASKVQKKDLKNAWQIGTRITSLAVYASAVKKLGQCSFYIEPKALDSIGVFDKKNIAKAYTIGYDEGAKAIASYLKQ